MKVTYSANNSGGFWWLSDDDWKALEDAGWTVEWRDSPFLDALATEATREGLSLRAAVEEFEAVTGQDASEEGCNCCGPPHSFHDEDYNSPTRVVETRFER